MNRISLRGSLVLSMVLVPLLLLGTGDSSRPDGAAQACMEAPESLLPLPSTLPLQDYERILYDFILRRTYATDLGWCVDKGVRDTGPWVQGKYYGTHPAVRIYYSPRVMTWLSGSREDPMPDGAMMVKEMFMPPAALYEELKDAPRYQDDPVAYDALLSTLISGWTIMIKDSEGSKDGWFWANPGIPRPRKDGTIPTIEEAIESQLDDYSHDLYAGFGVPCLRCHASAEDEFTFSALNNIEGFFPDEAPLAFRVDNSWRDEGHLDVYPLSKLLSGADSSYVQRLFVWPPSQRPWADEDVPGLVDFLQAHIPSVDPYIDSVNVQPLASVNPDFVATFPQAPGIAKTEVKAFPAQWADHVVSGAQGPEQYITSDNCLGCHGGLGGAPSGVTMFLKTGPNYGDGYNISEYGEWRWSPMGLAGRDPIFHAQLESEMVLLEQDAAVPSLLKGTLQENQQAVTNTCLSCHGAMGQRQLQIDARNDQQLDPNFKVDYFYLTELLSSSHQPPPDYAYHKYGELAREGISCAVCHHIDPPDPSAVMNWNPTEAGWITDSTPKELAYSLFHNSTGRYVAGPADELSGPFENVAEFPMENALGITPTYNAFIRDSQMCGTCHTISLPNIGMTEDEYPVLTAAGPHLVSPPTQPYYHTIEQATFLEWQNSAFAGADFQSCQDCHMPGGFTTLDETIDIPHLVTQIATIQDTNYPAVEHGAPAEDITVPPRDGYTRHEHVGLNVFLLEMFNQFPEILGVDEQDYMTSATTGNALAIENMLRQARNETVDLDVEVVSFQDHVLTADVTVTNKVGHRFPSGVAFRRAFLEFLVLDGEEVVWGSGRTNAVGVIVDGAGRPLETEFLPNKDTYQRHHQTITSQDQVQIYEELNQNADAEFTTSFIHRVHDVKDNRLLPKGWRASAFFKDQGEVIYQFMEATDPKSVDGDPDYQDQGPAFPGQDRLRYVVTLPDGLDPARLSVKVTMYYQSIPPFWLHQRFTLAPDGPATRRLYYLTSHLNLQGTVMEHWKLRLVSRIASLGDNG